MKKLAVFFALLMLSACTPKPSEEIISQRVQHLLSQQYGDTIFEVINFRKVNGISRDDNHYEAEEEYDMRFLVDLKDATVLLEKKSGSLFAAGMEATALGITYGNFKKGDTVHKKEWVKFVRSEQGWLIEGEIK